MLRHKVGDFPKGLFAIPLLASVTFFILILSHRWIPTHDTLGEVIWYQQLLSHLVHSGSVPVWYSGINWGHPLNYLIFVQNTPSLFLLAPVSFLFPSLNSVTLFYVAMFINELVLIGGLCALGSRLFKSHYTTLFVTVTFSSTIGWATQCWWNFHLFYALPLAFYFIHCGSYDKKPWKLALGFAIATLTGLLGSLLYLAPIQGLMCLIYLAFCLKDSHFYRRDWKFQKAEAIATVLLVVTFAVPVAILMGGDDTQFWIPKRDAAGNSSYADYLEYGSDLKLRSLQGLVDPLELGFNPGFTKDDKGTYLGDNSTYGGAFLFPLLLLCFLFSRSRARLPFFAMAGMVFLLYLNRSSFLAPLFYEIPGLDLFRHFGLLTPLLRFFLILLAGFGFDEVVSLLVEKRDRKALVTAIVGIIAVGIIGFSLYQSRDLSFAPQAAQRYALHLIVLGAALLWMVRLALHPTAKAGSFFLIGLALIDGYSFRSALYHQSLLPVSEEHWETFSLREPQYVPARNTTSLDDPKYERWFETILAGSGTAYAVSIPFLNLETCVRRLRTDYLAPASADLIRSLSDAPSLTPQTKRMTGCENPKATIYDGVSFADTEAEIVAKVGGTSTSPGLWVTRSEWSRVFEEEPTALSGQVVPGRVTLEAHRWNHLTFQSEVAPTGQTHWFTLAESWSPQWKAYVNGKAVPILKVNGGLRAVPIPSGVSRVEFDYDSAHIGRLYFILWLVIAGLFGAGLYWAGCVAASALQVRLKIRLQTSMG